VSAGDEASAGGEQPFDVEAFLAQPLVARVATSGTRVRPVWFLWEEGSFWWLTGSYSRMAQLLERDPQVALVVDTCDLGTGVVRVVSARGPAEVVPLDRERAVRKLSRYLGPDETQWDPRFREALAEDPSTRLVRLTPTVVRASDLSFRAPGVAGGP
jgi:nitroimidazol reductase NimA-like FMN-containing flavoprotein (pyridoxamine 5'-phosphate oxidase superfamily)